jgi:hypothetical protein
MRTKRYVAAALLAAILAAAFLLVQTFRASEPTSAPPAKPAPALSPTVAAAMTTKASVARRLTMIDAATRRLVRRPDLSANDRARMRDMLSAHEALAAKVIAEEPRADALGREGRLFELNKDIETLTADRPDLLGLLYQERTVVFNERNLLSSNPELVLEAMKRAEVAPTKVALLEKTLAQLKADLEAIREEHFAATPGHLTSAQYSVAAEPFGRAVDLKTAAAVGQILATLNDEELLAYEWKLLRAVEPQIVPRLAISSGGAPLKVPEDATYTLERLTKTAYEEVATASLKKGDPIGFQNGKAIAGEKEIPLSSDGPYTWLLRNQSATTGP